MSLDIPVYDELRHVISFTSYPGKINLNEEIKGFYKFVFNPSKRRISYVTEQKYNFRKISNPREVYSTDPSIQEFNKLFLSLNKQIPYEKINTYDMVTDTEDESIWQSFKKNLDQKMNLGIIVGGIVVLLYLNKKS